MKKNGYYSSGQFAALADVSVRTIRFYDRQNILKPSFVNENGARFYTDHDLGRLQQILLLKYLGFSLEDIRTMTLGQTGYRHLIDSLKLQLKLVQDRIGQMQSVEEAIRETAAELNRQEHSDTAEEGGADWQRILELIHLTGMEKSLASQYKNSSNLSARIALHNLCSVNKTGWFTWLFDKLCLRGGMEVLELGCGDGALWTQNRGRLPKDVTIRLSDISDGMIRDVKRSIGQDNLPGRPFQFYTFDCAHIPFEEGSFDLVIANHVLFYCSDIPQVLSEVFRVLKKPDSGGGLAPSPSGSSRFICSAYGRRHMAEITELVQEFDPHIVLSADRLYEQFGLENGEDILKKQFSRVELIRYEDALLVNDPQPLIEYILSCHGNQNHYIVDRYKEFHSFVQEKVKNGFHVTKDAGIFVCGV